MTMPMRLLGDRLLIQADVEDRAPAPTGTSGLFAAASLAAAVDGADPQDSWFVGTVIAVGPLVNWFDVRLYIRRRLTELADRGDRVSRRDLLALRDDLNQLPSDGIDPIRIGDRVTFSWASGQQLAINEQRYVILRSPDVLGVLIEDPRCPSCEQAGAGSPAHRHRSYCPRCDDGQPGPDSVRI